MQIINTDRLVVRMT